MENKRTTNKPIKKSIDPTDNRRNRTQNSISIKKETRKPDVLSKPLSTQETATILAPASDSDSPITSQLPRTLNECRTNMLSDVPELMLQGTQGLRKLLSIEVNPPIQQVIDAGLLPRLSQFLQRFDNPVLQFEATWALTNVASGSSDQTQHVISVGAVPIFIQLLQSPNVDVREQAIWALGNIAGDSSEHRDYLLNQGALSQLVMMAERFDTSTKLTLTRNTSWAISNLCRGKPAPAFETLAPALPLLSRLLFSSDMETVTDACWAMSYISDGPNERIQGVLQAGLGPRIVELLGMSESTIQTAALRTVGNIVTGDDVQTQFMISLGVIPALITLLDHPKKTLRKEACWTFSNLTAGTPEQIQAVLDSGAFTRLIQLATSAEYDIRKEAVWAVSNLTAGGTPVQIQSLIDAGGFQALTETLFLTDSKILLVALEGIENLLKHASSNGSESLERMRSFLETSGTLGRIENLQNDESQEVYRRSIRLLETYFITEEDS